MEQPTGSRGVALRLHGVRVRIDWSFLVLVGLVFWSLDSGLFAQAYPDLSAIGRAGLALVGTLLVVGSLTLHELCHAWQSQREGSGVREITLWMLGGVSQVARPVETPAAELRIVAAGPACTAVLTVVFLGVAGASYAVGGPDVVTGVIGYAAWINLVLLVFNLVPALPLDGGRLVHAVLWRRCGDRDRATIQAGRLGQALALGLVGVGVLLAAASTTPVSGLWSALIGLYLLMSARREVAAARLSTQLQGVPATDLLPPGSITIDGDTTLTGLTGLLYSRPDVHALAVSETGRLVGALVLTDAGAVPLESRDAVRVRDVMRPIDTLASVPATTSAWQVALQLLDPGSVVLVRGDSDLTTGMVTAEDLETFVAGQAERRHSTTRL